MGLIGPKRRGREVGVAVLRDNEIRDKLELDTMVRQGGFTVSSWLEIAQVIEEYRQQRGLDPSTMVVQVLLREGERIAISGIRAAFTWTVLLTEDDAIRDRRSRRPAPPGSATRAATGGIYRRTRRRGSPGRFLGGRRGCGHAGVDGT
jgi:hypothetical protein